MTHFNITTVREMIDDAIGDITDNAVDFKLMRSVLMILAKRLDLLERHVEVQFARRAKPVSSNIMITEMKIHTKKQKTSSKKGETPDEKRVELQNQGVRGTAASQGIHKETGGRGIEKTSGGRGIEKASGGRGTEKASGGRELEKASGGRGKEIASDGREIEKGSRNRGTEKALGSRGIEKASGSRGTEKSPGSRETERGPGSRGIEKISGSRETEKGPGSRGVRSVAPDNQEKRRYSEDYDTRKRDENERVERGHETRRDKSSSDKSSSYKPSSKETITSSATGASTHGVQGGRKNQTTPVSYDSAADKKSYERTRTKGKDSDYVHDKLIVVKRKPSETIDIDKRYRTDTFGGGRGYAGPTPISSVVTQDQFNYLVAKIRKVQARFGITPTVNALYPNKMMQGLYKGTSMTDPMAGIHLAARLEAAEKKLGKMISVLTDLADKTPGINLLDSFDTSYNINPNVGMFPQMQPSLSQKSTGYNQPSQLHGTQFRQEGQTERPLFSDPVETEFSKEAPYYDSLLGRSEQTFDIEKEPTKTRNLVKRDEFERRLQDLYSYFQTQVTDLSKHNVASTDIALKKTTNAGSRIEQCLQMGHSVAEMELVAEEYSERMTTLDAIVSSQMTNYQDKLTQMQFELEVGLDNMAEALANPNDDPTAVIELSNNFISFRLELDDTADMQDKLKASQEQYNIDLQDLMQRIESLRVSKSDREEVFDAMKDKAGIAQFNGCVSRQQFDAIRGQFEVQIRAAYEKFNNQEFLWQKIIDDVIKQINEKTAQVQMESLYHEFDMNSAILEQIMEEMLVIVGKPKDPYNDKTIERDSRCLCCSVSPHVNDITSIGDTTKSTSRNIEESVKPEEDGDHRLCYPGLPITHPLDQRAQVCQRYCGGHTSTTTGTGRRSVFKLTVEPRLKKSTTVGSDGKVYLIDDEHVEKNPCKPCNAV